MENGGRIGRKEGGRGGKARIIGEGRVNPL